MSRRKTPQEYHALAQLLGLIWRGPPVHSVTTMTTWECRCGNVFERTYNSIQQRNTGACKVCNKQVHKTTADYRALGESKELRWLGPVVTSVHHYTEWQCKRGHPPFKTSFHAIQRSGGNGCKHCSRKVPHTRAQYEALARKKNLCWLGQNVPGALEKTKWQCKNGHEPFLASYNSLTRPSRGNGCKQCAGMVPKTAEDYRALGKEREFKWRDKKVVNVGTPTLWECTLCGHLWKASFNNVASNGSGCPNCVDIVNGTRVSKQQRAIASLLDGSLNTICGTHPIDVAVNIEGVAIAVEYDSWYWHADKQEEDKRRDEALIASGWRVLRIKSNTLLPRKNQLDAAIAELLEGARVVEIQLGDWKTQKPFGTASRKRDERPSSKRTPSTPGVRIHAAAEDCVGELDRQILYIRCENIDLHKVKLMPAEVKLFKHALVTQWGDSRRQKPAILAFTCESVREALSQPQRSNRATRVMMYRLRRQIRFAEGNHASLLTGCTKRQCKTSIPICLRPAERMSNAIQTSMREWRAFKEGREFVRSLGLKKQQQWYQYSRGELPEKGTRPSDIPSNPQRTYKEHGWINWSDWLGSPSTDATSADPTRFVTSREQTT